jgi:predicted nucleic acid-binding protein
VISLVPGDILQRTATARRHNISHWDALILVAAEKAGGDIVYSEVLIHGQTDGTMRVCNPYIEDVLSRK